MKKIQVIMLPSSEKAQIAFLTKKGKEVFNDLRYFEKPMPIILDSENQHLYFLSDEEIKEGDWIYNTEREPQIIQCIGKGSLRGWKKIIATTDSSLKINNPHYDIGELAYVSVPQPLQEFIKDYVNAYNK